MKSADDRHVRKCGHVYVVVDRFITMNDNKKNLKTLLSNKPRRTRVSECKCKFHRSSIRRPKYANFSILRLLCKCMNILCKILAQVFHQI